MIKHIKKKTTQMIDDWNIQLIQIRTANLWLQIANNTERVTKQKSTCANEENHWIYSYT